MLESNNTDINSYIADTEDNYIRNLTSINPMILKNAFIEYFVDVISGNDNHKLSHIQNLMSKYSKYLGFQVLSDRVIEELIQKYSNVEQSRDIGALHAARISIFKLLEKSEVNG
ncbi:MAG UNVERIFIED_CONTAM: hypothetical protein LVQ98_01700 [Rickettsiaceae bacterium]|jgi:hypothetical protein